MVLVDPNSILVKHKRFLRNLEDAKTREKEEQDRLNQEREEKKKAFKDIAAN